MDAIHLEIKSEDNKVAGTAVEFEEFSRAMQRLKLDVEVVSKCSEGGHGIDVTTLFVFRF